MKNKRGFSLAEVLIALGVLGVIAFLFIGLFRLDGWYGRLVMVMPMEYAMYAFLVMVYGLVQWGRDQK